MSQLIARYWARVGYLAIGLDHLGEIPGLLSIAARFIHIISQWRRIPSLPVCWFAQAGSDESLFLPRPS
jgi:hypothetical protein